MCPHSPVRLRLPLVLIAVQVETLFTTTGGWVTNRRSACVQLAFEWAILRMSESGEIGRYRNAWLTETGCSAAAEIAAEQGGRRARDRRLSETMWFSSWWPPRALGGEIHRAPPVAGRRLRGNTADTAVADAGEGEGEVRQLTLVDFLGLFIIFAVMTAIIIIGNEIAIRCGEFRAYVHWRAPKTHTHTSF